MRGATRRSGRWVAWAILPAIGCGLGARPAAGQEPVDPEAKEIIETALARYWDRMAGVENFVLVQQTGGFELRSTFVRREVNGRPVFVQRDDEEDAGAEPQEDSLSDPYAIFPQLADRARLAESEEVDGHTCYVLEIEDLSGVDFGSVGPDPNSAFTPRRSVLHLDEAQLILRRLTMQGDLERGGAAHPVTVVASRQDFREVDGMIYPFRTVVTTEGLAAAISDQEREETRRNLEMIRARLDSMPEAQRRMIENAMSEQIEMLERALEGGGMEIVSQVIELRVNVELPNDG